VAASIRLTEGSRKACFSEFSQLFYSGTFLKRRVARGIEIYGKTILSTCISYKKRRRVSRALEETSKPYEEMKITVEELCKICVYFKVRRGNPYCSLT
jgi:hypothetical protein